MTLSEFKAWFEGYTEGIEVAPTKAQFERIKEKVKEISGTPVSYPVYIDRYVEPYRHWYWSTSGGIGMGTATMGSMQGGSLMGSDQGGAMYRNDAAFDSHAAMYALGKVESQMN